MLHGPLSLSLLWSRCLSHKKPQNLERESSLMDADGHHHGMDGTAPPPSSSPSMDMEKMVMHGSFFWGSRAEIVFKNWPGSSSSSSSSPGMYVLALLFVFVLAFLVEWLSHRGIGLVGSSNSGWWVGVVRTIVHAVRVGLAYVLMLAVMSFNVGVFLVAVAGHALGFLVFGTRKSPPPGYWEGL